MTARGRISRGTPYIQTGVEIENILAACTPQMEEDIAAMLGMTLTEWRALSEAHRVKHLIDHQIRGLGAATFAAASKAQTDLTESAHAITAQAEASVLRDEVAALREMVADLIKATDPKHATRKGK